MIISRSVLLRTSNASEDILLYKFQQDATLHSLFCLRTPLHVSGVTITLLQEHKTTVTAATDNCYTVIERVKFTDKEYLFFSVALRPNVGHGLLILEVF